MDDTANEVTDTAQGLSAASILGGQIGQIGRFDYRRQQALSIVLQAAGGPKQIDDLLADADKVMAWLDKE